MDGKYIDEEGNFMRKDGNLRFEIWHLCYFGILQYTRYFDSEVSPHRTTLSYTSHTEIKR